MRVFVAPVQRSSLTSAARGTCRPLHAMGSNQRQNPVLNLSPHSDRVLGCLLGVTCGDVLGCSVEGWSHDRIRQEHPGGLKDFQDTQRGYGCYTDDTNMTIALAVSLVRKKTCCSEDCAAEYGRMFQPWRGYGGTAVKILKALQSGADHRTIGTRYIPGGSFANGGAMRIAPVGLAYRNAGTQVMRQAVTHALLCTHVHPCAVDGAMMQALTIAELCKTTPQTFAPGKLMDTLLAAAETDEMKGKLSLLKESLPAIHQHQGVENADWAQHLNSPSWDYTLKVAADLSDAFQIKATDAVAVTLLSFLLHWRQPEDAIVCAVHLGGDTDTIASMVGALVGALHGRAWVPQRWFDNIENEEYGRDMVVDLSGQLAELDLSDTAPRLETGGCP